MVPVRRNSGRTEILTRVGAITDFRTGSRTAFKIDMVVRDVGHVTAHDGSARKISQGSV